MKRRTMKKRAAWAREAKRLWWKRMRGTHDLEMMRVGAERDGRRFADLIIPTEAEASAFTPAVVRETLAKRLAEWQGRGFVDLAYASDQVRGYDVVDVIEDKLKTEWHTPGDGFEFKVEGGNDGS